MVNDINKKMQIKSGNKKLSPIVETKGFSIAT